MLLTLLLSFDGTGDAPAGPGVHLAMTRDDPSPRSPLLPP
ncbi:MAG: hypothetical protein K0S43_477 [Cellulosimicrobium sp.]|jgi:hypothetical protein|nr:hypothetical protein [Cellulosimicrobium sp.]